MARARPDAVPGTVFDIAAAAAGGTVTFYEFECGCDDIIRLRKEPGATGIVLE